MNGDGKPDLLVTDQFTNSVLTMLNTLNTYIPGTAGSVRSLVPALEN